ncbi:hypothetical protein [Nitrincola tapanii]|uniref:Uncharacterized protein n=1 Tax=Nitrincola tapanii TaxID=1708751 RepID=A0A5A9W778_9GAMM|nr:hypothetical protein [Nitrincola tapanii]KAA0875321.1 hypothetical protein E1H14_04820 [Nitrincola tapanii]
MFGLVNTCGQQEVQQTTEQSDTAQAEQGVFDGRSKAGQLVSSVMSEQADAGDAAKQVSNGDDV